MSLMSCKFVKLKNRMEYTSQRNEGIHLACFVPPTSQKVKTLARLIIKYGASFKKECTRGKCEMSTVDVLHEHN